MTTVNTIVADAATLHALLQVVVADQIHLADIEAQNRVTWLLHLAVTLADKVAIAADELVTELEGDAPHA
jgi:hypothetical protein